MRRRNNQLYSAGALIGRWKKIERDLDAADRIARQTALHSLLHHPGAVFTLGARTFLQYFDVQHLQNQAKSDLGKVDWPVTLTGKMESQFRLAPPRHSGKPRHSILQRYFLGALPYYYVALLSPLLCGILFFFFRESSVSLLFVHGAIFLTTDSFLAVTASVRYLQPLSFITILTVPLLVDVLKTRRTALVSTIP
jgi:hypothetical protein